ncbi:MAG TPA: Gfo/Idh/MocA family oxidoreductase [Trueperaceae bacterium]
MNVGVIGIAGFGQHHAQAFEELGCQVVAVADVATSVTDWAVRFSATPYRDYRELLQHNGLQAVSVSLPPRLHPEVVRACVAQHLPVFCEKPIAPSAVEAERLLAELGEDAPVAVGFSFRYHPAYQRLRDLMQGGTLGRIRTIDARKCWGTRTPWRLQEGGGAVFIKDIHYFDLIPWLLGEEPQQLCAFGGAFFHQAPVEDSYQLLMAFRGGCVFHLDSAWWTLPTAVSHFEVVGDKARVVVEDGTLRITGEQTREETPEGEAMVRAEIRAFVDWLQGDGRRPPGLPEAVRANRYAQQVVDALRGRVEAGR